MLKKLIKNEKKRSNSEKKCEKIKITKIKHIGHDRKDITPPLSHYKRVPERKKEKRITG